MALPVTRVRSQVRVVAMSAPDSVHPAVEVVRAAGLGAEEAAREAEDLVVADQAGVAVVEVEAAVVVAVAEAAAVPSQAGAAGAADVEAQVRRDCSASARTAIAIRSTTPTRIRI